MNISGACMTHGIPLREADPNQRLFSIKHTGTTKGISPAYPRICINLSNGVDGASSILIIAHL
jgi:hypothetical protein